eukprot:Sdes_comp20798_c0_seq7m17087
MEYKSKACTVKSELDRIEQLESHGSAEDAIISLIGVLVAKLHRENIIHGDLTTSNMLLEGNSENIILIDFGLSYVSSLAEDKAVDLYVLERAFASTHPKSENLFAHVLKAYKNHYPDSKAVLSRLDEVRLRGRKKICIG